MFTPNNYKLWGIILVLLIVVLWYYTLIYQSYLVHNLVNGFWEADSTFCTEAEIDMFCIYFDEDVDFFGNRACYVLAKKDGVVIINEPTIAKLSLQWMCTGNWSANISTPKYFNINFKHIDEECREFFPQYQEMRFYPICNKMVLFAGDTITAVLYKNPVNTELKSMLEE